ncbi:unnamed protein product [Peniophora sp. CBMAI 1063]|nr:unnamed protein product [Peniophora sp. CBMAI 1063]
MATSLPQSLHNYTQELQVLNALHDYTTSSIVPSLLFESFIVGVLFASVPLGSYLISAKLRSDARIPLILSQWAVSIAVITHWGLSLHQLYRLLDGSALGIALGEPDDATLNSKDFSIHTDYANAWTYLLPIVTETVLFGLVTVLFVVTAWTTLRQLHTRRLSFATGLVPAVATVMYAFSLAHWAVSVQYFTADAHAINQSGNDNDVVPPVTALVVLLTLNAVMGDAIVLWRMCVVWKNKRPILVFAVGLALVTLALNIVNVVVTADNNGYQNKFLVQQNVPVFSETILGIMAAFISLASNACATMLVGIKVWLLRSQLANHAHTSDRRTVVERFMELLVDSGLVYTGIWIFYCVSFFMPIATHTFLQVESLSYSIQITAVDHLNAGMAQMTTIYPLIIFILVALDRTYHEHGPRALHTSEQLSRWDADVPIALDMHVMGDERGRERSEGAASYSKVSNPTDSW